MRPQPAATATYPRLAVSEELQEVSEPQSLSVYHGAPRLSFPGAKATTPESPNPGLFAIMLLACIAKRSLARYYTPQLPRRVIESADAFVLLAAFPIQCYQHHVYDKGGRAWAFDLYKYVGSVASRPQASANVGR